MEFYESFMKFRFPDEDVYCIEKDQLVREFANVKACECIVYIHPRIALIEAKASSPKDIKGAKFQKFISDIVKKFADSLRLYDDTKNKRYGEDAFLRLPRHLQNLHISSENYALYLIIHGHPLDWLAPLQDALRYAMHDVISQWHIKDSQVKVFNEEMALAYSLIVNYIPKNERDSVRDKDGNMSLEKALSWFDSHSQ